MTFQEVPPLHLSCVCQFCMRIHTTVHCIDVLVTLKCSQLYIIHERTRFTGEL